MSDETENEFTTRAEPGLPDGVGRWNWGAFLLNWIWGLGNRSYLPAILMFVPGVNLLMPFVFGFMGNKWAWRKVDWDDVDHFLDVQRRWSIAGAVVFMLAVVGVSGGAFWYQKFLTKSEPYQLAMRQILADVGAVDAMGGRVRPGWYVVGDLRPFGTQPETWLRFPVQGHTGKAEAEARAARDGDGWELTSLELRAGGQTLTLRLPGQVMKLALDEGRAALDAGDSVRAVEQLTIAAELRSAEAQFLLGRTYADGAGIEADPKAAKDWLERAAAQGHAAAQTRLEELLATMAPEPTPEEKQAMAEAEQLMRIQSEIEVAAAAVDELKALAERGNTDAQLFLADMMFAGSGVRQNFSMAAMWYRRAAENGNADAQFMLGSMYLRGNALPRSIDDAREWLVKAAEQDHPKAGAELRLLGDLLAESGS